MKYTAFVPARSGSKRLPNKNIKLLGGKPLVVWTLEACVNSPAVDEVIFSTDSTEYWNVVRKYIKSDKLVLDNRSSEEAGDQVKIFDYLKNNVDKIFQGKSGSFILALPTMPLRTTLHIEEAIGLSRELKKPVFSAVEYDFSVSFAFNLVEKSWSPMFEGSPMITGNTRSQDQLPAFHPNGAIYIRDINDLRRKSLTSLYEEACPMIMSKLESVDIDTEYDFKLAELMLEI